jgi:di/tricarboxylate transporter
MVSSPDAMTPGNNSDGPGRAIDHAAHARLLGDVDLFAELDRVTLAKLAARLQPESYTPGVIIIRQGEPGDAFYLVASGVLHVYTTDAGRVTETHVRTLRSGEPFGEMALLTSNPRSATVKAETECEVLRLERSAFLDLVKQQPSVALAIAGTLSRRLAGTSPATPPTPSPALTVPARRRWRLGRAGGALAAAAAMFALGWLVPPPADMSPTAWHALATMLAALPALALDVLLEGVLGFLLIGAWVSLGVVPAAVALSGFGTTSWVLVVCVLMIGAAITASGVLYRLALGVITNIRGGYPGEVAALSVAGLLMGPAVPNATSRVIIIAPMLRELIDALGYRAQSRGAAGLAMAVLIGFGQMAAVFLTSSTTAVLVAAVLPPAARADVNWLTWAFYGAPVNAVLFLGLLASLLWLYRPAAGERQPVSERRTSLALQRAVLGPMSRHEKIALAVGIALLAGFVTQPFHRVDPAWVAVGAVGMLAATRVLTLDSLRAVNWNFALLFGVLISLAAVFKSTGLDRWIAGRAAATAGPLAATPIGFLLALSLLCMVVSLVVRWQAAAPLVTIALAPVASAAGIHPFVIGVIAVIACNGFFLPYQSTTYLALYAGTGGKVFTHREALGTALAYGACTLIAVALSVPAWRMMGLLRP